MRQRVMMNLRSTLKLAHSLLEENQIDHALIGGLALACYGSTRATVDLDLIVREESKDLIKKYLPGLGENQDLFDQWEVINEIKNKT